MTSTTLVERLPETRRFRRRVAVSVLSPIATLLAFSALLALEIRTLVHDSALLDRSDRVLADTAMVEKLHVDLETGLRGALLTGDDRFLQPYREALPRVDPSIDALAGLLTNEGAQATGVSGLRQRSGTWRRLALRLLADPAAGQARADPVLVRTVLENLLANAFKFVRPGETARVEVGTSAPGTFFVRDEGIGFDAASAGERIFLPFFFFTLGDGRGEPR